jgi:glutathione S-transferase
MALELHYHPLASYCHKVLVALYENDTPFEKHLVDLGDPAAAARFRAISPMAKMPALRDGERTVFESTIIIEHLALHHPGPVRLVPEDPDRALDTRFRDRFFDCYLQDPMQKIVGDRIRPERQRDPFGVAQAKAQLETAYAWLESELRDRTWAAGDSFGMADCAAAPALFYANEVLPLGDRHPRVAAYLVRLKERPSFRRVLAEAEPYFSMFPR